MRHNTPRPEARPREKQGLYVFDPDTLHQIALSGVGKPHAQMCQVVIEGLERAYPEWIRPQEWIFNCAGGAVGAMKLLHASLSEYLLIFGTPIGTEGFSGRYRVGIYDFMLAGEMWTYTNDAIGEKVISRPGDRAYLSPDQVKGYKLPDGAWMLEYGRGPIPTVLPFGLANAVFTMMDGEMVRQTVFTYGKLTLRNLLKGKI
jgi:C-8 sterol isomerase